MKYAEVAKLKHDKGCAFLKGDDYCDCGAIEKAITDDNDRLRARVAELEDAILDWHREDRDSEDQNRASMRLYNVAEEIRLRKGLDLGHNRAWTRPGELERTGYLDNHSLSRNSAGVSLSKGLLEKGDSVVTPETKIPWLEGEPTIASLLEQHHTDRARIAQLETGINEILALACGKNQTSQTFWEAYVIAHELRYPTNPS